MQVVQSLPSGLFGEQLNFDHFVKSQEHVILMGFRVAKTYCAAFCASPALLAGSSNNAGCNSGKIGGLLISSNKVQCTRM